MVGSNSEPLDQGYAALLTELVKLMFEAGFDNYVCVYVAYISSPSNIAFFRALLLNAFRVCFVLEYVHLVYTSILVYKLTSRVNFASTVGKAAEL